MLRITLPDIISWYTYPQQFTRWLIANFSVLSLSTTFRGAREAAHVPKNVFRSVAYAVYAEFEVVHQFSLRNVFT